MKNTELLNGTAGLVLVIVAVILTAMWLFFPWMVYTYLKKIAASLKALESKEAVRIEAPAAAARKTPPLSESYYFAKGEEVSGPFTFEKLRTLRERGLIDDETLVCAEGAPSWSKWREFA